MKTITIRSKLDSNKEFVENFFEDQLEAEQFLKLYIKKNTQAVLIEPNKLVIELDKDIITYTIEELIF